MRRRFITLIANQGPSDTTRPTCTITCAQTSPTATSPLNFTFTFSEIVTGFALGDITVGNGTAGNFAGSGTTYTADVTPTATGAVTVDVAEGVCQDGASNTNTAATQFSITAIVYTLNDLFTTNDAAPLTSPRTCEPGPGTITFTDTGNRGSISSGALLYTLTAGTDWGNPGGWGAGISRAAGLAFLGQWRTSAATRSMIGFDTNQAATVDDNSFHTDASGLVILARVGGVSIPLVVPYTAAADHSCEVIQRAAGAFYVWNDELLWVDASRSTATVYPAIVAGDTAAGGPVLSFASARAAQLPAPWTTDAGIATQILSGARSAGDTFTHEANCLIDFTVTTLPSAGNIDIRFREQDTSNYWQLLISATGGFTLNEVVAGTPTSRATQASAVSNGERVVIVCRNTTIRCQEAGVAADFCTYASASNFSTATAGRLSDEGTGGAVTTIITWPMTLSGAAKAVLDAANP
jgi:hypothetical protein